MSTLRGRLASSALRTDRIEALTDGVFAVAFTLLILNIQVPQIPAALIAGELPQRLLELWPKLLSYMLSFLIIGVYWVGHHNQFHFIRHADRTLLWINVLFLMCIAFIPFSAALLGEYGQQRIALVVYGATLVVVGLVLYLHWWYGTSGNRLVDEAVTPEVNRTVTRRILTPLVIYLVAIGLSFFSVDASLILYIFVPVLYILPGRIDRHFAGAHHGQGAEDSSLVASNLEERVE
jgi:uncharacterized membrane protein